MFFLWNQDFKYEENSEKAVECLNDMVTNALIHAEECLQYMSALKDHAIFRFCAIPQVHNLFDFILPIEDLVFQRYSGAPFVNLVPGWTLLFRIVTQIYT